ncbi:MAG TPA: hypothetical protein VIC26_01055, partial [Marinagarivorans sp.]
AHTASPPVTAKRFHIDIAAQRLDDALLVLSAQTHTSIAFNPTVDASMPTTPAVAGELTVAQALAALVNNSGYALTPAGSGFVVKAVVDKREPRLADTPVFTAPPLEELFITGSKVKGSASLAQRRSRQHLNADAIKLFAINDLDRVSTRMPGIDYHQGSSPTLYIRGVGIDDNTDLSDPLVKYSENGGYTAQLAAFMGNWHDLASLQIEPGPQNHSNAEASVGGHVQVNFKAPQFEHDSANLGVTTGSFNTRKLTGFANLGINEQHALRLSAQGYKRDSYFTNYGEPTTDIPGRIDASSLRWQYHFSNQDDFTARIIHNRSRDDGTGNTAVSLTAYLQDGRRPSHTPRVADIPMSAIDDIYFVNVDSKQRNRFQSSQIIARYSPGWLDINAQVHSSAGTLQKTIGKNKGPAVAGKHPSAPDINDAALNQFDFYTDYKDQTTRTATLTVALQGDALSWRNRFNYSDEDLHWFWGDSDDMANGYMGGQFDTHYRANTQSWYSELTYSPTTQQALTLGVRETRNNKRRAGIGILTENSELPNLRHGSRGFEWALGNKRIRSPNDFDDPNELDDNGVPVVNLSAEDLAFVTPREQWEAYNAGVRQWGENDTVEDYFANNGYQGNNFYITSQDSAISDSAFDWQLHYARDLNASKNLRHSSYVALRTATSNSGFNDGFGNGSYPTYRAEKAQALDIGYDADTQRSSVKSSIFYYKYTDKIAIINMAPSHFDPLTQGINRTATNGNTAASTNLDTTNDFRVNIPKARSYGATIAISHQFGTNWQLDLNGQYLNAQYTKGRLIDARMAPFSGFTNADPLRFNTPETQVIIPDSEQGFYTHTYNIYDYLAEPEYQTARPGADMNGDGLSSHYYQTACTQGQATVVGDGQCYTVLNQAPDIEHPVRNLKGNKMPRSPSWDLYAAVQYRTVQAIGALTFSLGMKYRSDYYLSPYNGEGYEPQPFDEGGATGEPSYDEAPSFFSRVPAHITFDMAAKWQSAGRKPWAVSLAGKNITNQRYFTKISNTAWTYSVESNMPRVFELTLEKHF